MVSYFVKSTTNLKTSLNDTLQQTYVISFSQAFSTGLIITENVLVNKVQYLVDSLKCNLETTGSVRIKLRVEDGSCYK